MLQIRSIRLRGDGLTDAVVNFVDGSNVLAGPSDSGKSYLVHCLDYILGADEMRKRIPEAEPYSQLFVEFQNSEQQSLTLQRSLAGGDLAAYQLGIADLDGQEGEKIIASRSGKSHAKDVTSVMFEFAEIEEARLRKDTSGGTQRLTIRTLLPLFIVDEILVIDETSPVLGRASFDRTARKRAFAYLLTGKDDSDIIAAERNEITSARLNAKLALIVDLLSPIEERLQRSPASEESIENVEDDIAALSKFLADHSAERALLEVERRDALEALRRAESQTIAIDELLIQYRLLEDRYRTDLERLDFIAEGAHFFDGLQEVRCPLCDQLMSQDHAHKAAERTDSIYESAKAEAAKILALRTDLVAATASLTERRATRQRERHQSDSKIKQVDARNNLLAPAMQETSERLDRLVARRLKLEVARSDEAQATNLKLMRQQLESTPSAGSHSRKWEPLPAAALRRFCSEIEAILTEWNWKGDGRVDFDESNYDIIVDGQARHSHGKGVRAILYSAFVIGLLRYCHANQRPHPGLVVIDSPLTSYKKGKSGEAADGPVSADMEMAFWRSLTVHRPGFQLIIIENKEPASEVAGAVHYQWFAGENAGPGERAGFIPEADS